MKKLFFLISLIVLVASCSNIETLQNCDLRDYFYSVEQFADPKFHVIEKDSFGYKSREYWKIEKIQPNRIQITMYDSELNPYSKLIDRFKSKEVVIDFIGSKVDSGYLEANFESGNIFDFQNQNSKYGYSMSYALDEPQKLEIKESTVLERVELTKKYINGDSLSTIISNGYVHRIEKYSNYNFKIPLTVWYTKGIGVTLMKEDYGSGSITHKYIETIDSTEIDIN